MDVSFTRVTTSLVMLGIMRLTTWGQNDAHKGLELGIAQDAGGLILTHGHGINAAAVNFREVGGIVDGKGDDHGNEFIPGYAQIRKQIVRAIGDRQSCSIGECRAERR